MPSWLWDEIGKEIVLHLLYDTIARTTHFVTLFVDIT
jgi:hypothetical protein